jgi:Holliday junction resolvase
MNDNDRKSLNEFFSAIQPNLAGYKHSSFSYLALRKGDGFELAQGRLLLHGTQMMSPSKYFESESIKAEFYRIDEVKLTLGEFIESLLTGKFQTPHGEIRFPPDQGGSYSIYFNPFFSNGTPNQYRQMQLCLRGNRRDYLDSPKFDWELKAAATPFENVQELCADFSIGSTNGDFATVEILAFSVAAVGVESFVNGTKAKLVINLANGLEREKSSVGYRIIERNSVVKRGLISGAALSWQNANMFQSGQAELEVSAGAVLHCFACYGGRAQHHYWVADPSTPQNPFRAVHQAFDNKLEILQELISKAQSRGANARDLEVAIAWLLWMLGFSATHIGGSPKTSDAPDLIATTPQGHFLVIECTTGILKEDSKLAHLVDRAAKVRQSLAASGNRHLKVLPIIVTTKTREEVKAESEQALKSGVLVATRETFDELLTRTLVHPDADRLYDMAEDALRRVQNQLTLPNIEAGNM